MKVAGSQWLGVSKKVLSITLSGILLMLLQSVEAQQHKKIPRVGFLVAPSRSFFSVRLEGFQQGLRELGYVEGKNIAIEYRFGEGKVDRISEFAAELVSLKVDIIVTSGVAAFAAKNATKSIPVVFAAVQDPVASGLVDSLARPESNLTGLSNLAPELGGKRLGLLKEVVPKITRVGVLWGSSRTPVTVKEAQAAAKALGLQFHLMEVLDPNDFDTVFEAAIKNHVHALLTTPGAFINSHQARILEFATKNQLPTIYGEPEFVNAGGLMSYAPNSADLFRRAATYVDRILKGAKPADLPVEQPKKFELIINLKTAKQIGLTIPPNVLARADKVIR